MVPGLEQFEIYFSGGIGTVWQESRREIGTWAFVGNYWQFALSPEAGLIFPVGQSFLTTKVRYVHGFKTTDAPTLSYLGFGLGFAW